ncbi:MAG: PIG-L family deacetylase [Acaryochloris sp. RU_4_1]|nr:PIG-L family deacetylase [Acaryochloris sp. RU_4_1]NJR53514.1 PIG-L family deacetylase [Acaryochloris sp. CRU_2_0]
MLKIDFTKNSNSVYKVLCLGAHSDDIEIGCGGTILKLIETYSNIIFYWVVFSSDEQREKEANKSVNSFLKGAKIGKIEIKNFRNSFFPFVGADIKEYFEKLKKDFSPDLIFTHYRNDRHQDHRLVSDLTWNTYRDHLILEYEIPKYDGDLGSPNIFVHLDPSICQRKINFLMEYFATQSNKQWFTEDTFLSVLRLRGIESNALAKYAEAFYCRKAILL